MDDYVEAKAHIMYEFQSGDLSPEMMKNIIRNYISDMKNAQKNDLKRKPSVIGEDEFWKSID